ncbi:e2698ddd-c056-42c6-97ec-a4d80fbfb5fa [Sclerotinia trifoliorum]|uniref:E2698ddd-c056-42c6-97ec-a4d80fbfb5fa n=1 Tax=Sclerotinia trifoliorum TaxID=28548 RepID=A0A8H2ZVA0_9HELO|nr:e2698ddd-c056-42c6-97ec-a4d80fbfb5fa [Sclerotinia trifoliorum]
MSSQSSQLPIREYNKQSVNDFEGQQYGESATRASAARASDNDPQYRKTDTSNGYQAGRQPSPRQDATGKRPLLKKKHKASRHKKFKEEAEEDKEVANRVHYKVGGSGGGERDNEAKNFEQRRALLIEKNRAAEKEENEKQRNMGHYFEED